jgi:hypothetical protein
LSNPRATSTGRETTAEIVAIRIVAAVIMALLSGKAQVR